MDMAIADTSETRPTVPGSTEVPVIWPTLLTMLPVAGKVTKLCGIPVSYRNERVELTLS